MPEHNEILYNARHMDDERRQTGELFSLAVTAFAVVAADSFGSTEAGQGRRMRK